jgi:predicted  nucleic acid-binding Zn-ribbon protein
LDSAQREFDDLKKELYEAQKKIVRLETELNDVEKKR